MKFNSELKWKINYTTLLTELYNANWYQQERHLNEMTTMGEKSKLLFNSSDRYKINVH